MFGFSFSELLIVLLVAVLVFRPNDFPLIIKKVGKWYGKWLRIYYGFVDEINDIVHAEEDNEKAPQHTEKRGGSHDRNN